MAFWHIGLQEISFGRIPKREKLDIIIFAASGLMGRFAIAEASNVLKDYRWGIAGRNAEKLREALLDASIRTKNNLNEVPIFIADIFDKRSLYYMTQNCRILINCCGPYEDFGEPVIKACLSSGTHYVDLCAEPYYMQLMALKYNKKAAKRKIYIVQACGLESLPIEIGINYANKKFNGTINTIDAYTEYWNEVDDMRPIGTNSGWASFVFALASMKDIEDVRAVLQPKQYSYIKDERITKEIEVVKGFSLPFPFVTQQVVECSQYYFFDKKRRRPVQFSHYLVFPSYILAGIFFIWWIMITILAQLKPIRDLLLTNARIFSLGFFSNECRSVEQMENTMYRTTLKAVGWSSSSDDPHYTHNSTIDQSLVISIEGVNPFYGISSVCLLASAVTILNEHKKMPEHGGVISPGAAFANTKIKQRLEGGLQFRIIPN